MCVCDWRDYDSKVDADNNDSNSSEVLNCFGDAEKVEWLSPMRRKNNDSDGADTNAKTKTDDPWWFADAVVVLVSARSGEGELDGEDEEPPLLSEESAQLNDVSTQHPDETFFRRQRQESAEENTSEELSMSASSSWTFPFFGADTKPKAFVSRKILKDIERLTQQLNSSKDVFVVCESCDNKEGRPLVENAATLINTSIPGIDTHQVLCLETTLAEEGRFGSSNNKNCEWRHTLRNWYCGWARDRSSVLWPAYARARSTIRFWGALAADADLNYSSQSRADEESEVNADGVALRSAAKAANAGIETSSTDTETSSTSNQSGTSTSTSKISAVASAAALRSNGSFLKWAIEGRPNLGIEGAPQVAQSRLKHDPQLRKRTSLVTTLYGYSALEFTAGFVLSWAVPGPLAAHAAHFTNRYRICFAVACMSGEDLLDPKIVATVLSTCVGADGRATKEKEYFGASRSSSDVSSADENMNDEKSTNTDPGLDTKIAPEKTLLLSSLNSAVRRVQDTSDSIRKDAMESMRRVYTAGGDAVGAAERNALFTARKVLAAVLKAATDSIEKYTETESVFSFFHRDGRTRRLFSSPESCANEAATRVYDYILSTCTAVETSKLVCGPLWLAATQADVVSVLAGAMSVHVCNESLRVFLPPRGVEILDRQRMNIEAILMADENNGKSSTVSHLAAGLARNTAATVTNVTSALNSAVTSGIDSTSKFSKDVTVGLHRWVSVAVNAAQLKPSRNGHVPTLNDGGVDKLVAADSLDASIRVTRDTLVRMVNDPDVRSFVQRPYVIMTLMSDPQTAQFVIDDKIRSVLSAMNRSNNHKAESAETENVENVPLISNTETPLCESIPEEDIQVALAAAKHVFGVLLQQGDPDILAAATKHGIFGDTVSSKSDEDTETQNIKNHEFIKAERYAGYREAVANIKDKYRKGSSFPDALNPKTDLIPPEEPVNNWYDFSDQLPALPTVGLEGLFGSTSEPNKEKV